MHLSGVLILLVVAGCGGMKPDPVPEGPHWVDLDTEPIPEPPSRNPRLAWQSVDRSFIVQAEQFFDFDRLGRKIGGDPRQAYNINSFDEVPNSSWFTNRHGLSPMTPEQIAAGDTTLPIPDPNGEWVLSRPKVGGATPGFWIKDQNGNRFIIKFDPVGFPEMATAAEVMGSRYFYAAGYNAPKSSIVYWRPEQLRIKEGLEFTDRDGNRRTFTQEDLDDLLERVEQQPDGTFRSSASPLLPNAKGSFSYTGRNKHDPNDWCPHEHRRDLRSLFVIASLINHYDTKDQNSLDVFWETEQGGYLRHYLIDFGSAFGSDGDGAKIPRQGYANYFDLRDVFVNWASLGTKKWGWENGGDPQYPSVGYFESEIFDPQKFDPIVPNPAFENMTGRDAYWGAKIVMAFEEPHIRAIVGTGEFSDPEAREYMVQTLLERREKIGRHWFGRVNPLHVKSSFHSASGIQLDLEDLAIRYGLAEASTSSYSLTVRHDGKKVATEAFTEVPDLIPSATMDLMRSRFADNGNQDGSKRLVDVLIHTSRNNQVLPHALELTYWFDSETATFKLVGIVHHD
jgi:hypothetical protein